MNTRNLINLAGFAVILLQSIIILRLSGEETTKPVHSMLPSNHSAMLGKQQPSQQALSLMIQQTIREELSKLPSQEPAATTQKNIDTDTHSLANENHLKSKAAEVIDIAIANGVWSEQDYQQSTALITKLNAEEKWALLEKIGTAINNGMQVQADLPL